MSSGDDNPWDQARPKFKRRRPEFEDDGSRSTRPDQRGGRPDQSGHNEVPAPRVPRDPRRRSPSASSQGGVGAKGSGTRREPGSKDPQTSSFGRESVGDPGVDAGGDEALASEAQVSDITSGRLLAWVALQRHDHSTAFLQDILADLDGKHQLRSSERAAAVDLSAGIVRRRRTIDALLGAQMTRPRTNIENDLWRVLQLGVFQLVFGRTPAHAAVDSTVELCRQLQRERWTRFVNGVLRGVGRLITDDIVDDPELAAVPMTDGQWRRLHKPIFPDRTTHFAEWLAESFSLPDSLARRWTLHMTPAQCVAAAFYALQTPGTTLRVNRLRADAVTVAGQLEAAGCVMQAGSLEECLRLRGGSRIERLPGFAEGLWSVQDEAAMNAALLLAPRAGERVLDLCAAPGGKTCHLAELADDNCEILACDVSLPRLARVQENADRLGLTSITTRLIDREGTDIPAGPFDAILVDVPCSNTGVLGRRPEARWRFSEHELLELIPLQIRLLTAACERAAPGGRIVYSTCSIEPEENQGVVQAVLRACPDFELRMEQAHVPGCPADGAYQALLMRAGEAAAGR